MTSNPLPTAPTRLRVLGRHVPTGGWQVAASEGGGRFVVHDAAGPGRFGPVQTDHGVRWLADATDGISLWGLVVAHPHGIAEPVACALLRAVAQAASVAGDGEGVDPESTWLSASSRLSVQVGRATAVPWSQLLRYLCRGESAHHAATDDPVCVGAIEGMCASDVVEALAEGEPAALPALVRETVPDDLDPQDGHPDFTLLVAAPPAEGLSRAQVSKIAGLTMALGWALGWTWAPRPAPPAGQIDVAWVGEEPVEGLTVACGAARAASDGPRLRMQVPLSGCRVDVRWEGGSGSAPLDTARHLKYECRQSRGELECDER